ncbi:hypothetical protein NPIL_405041 [Nephila pilipes]|uniref:Uncharacterized protein n=1 Tax=Nephila pilipes TaxID=299642 RepID=A0A8X6TUY1_NEPPI|nr:hypothetical protein NPIL_405041 [Nephila pilipes]
MDELAQTTGKIYELSGSDFTIENVESKGPDLNAVLAEVAEIKEIVKGIFSPWSRSRRSQMYRTVRLDETLKDTSVLSARDLKVACSNHVRITNWGNLLNVIGDNGELTTEVRR